MQIAPVGRQPIGFFGVGEKGYRWLGTDQNQVLRARQNVRRLLTEIWQPERLSPTRSTMHT